MAKRKISPQVDDIRMHATRCEPVGSRVTCNPPPVDTDCDYLVLAGDLLWCRLLTGHEWREQEMFSPEKTVWVSAGSDVNDSENTTPENQRFRSYRNGDDNIIVTKSVEFYDRFLAATSVAKRLNLMRKSDRVALFQAVLYGNRCD
jgi:hypothetical protein